MSNDTLDKIDDAIRKIQGTNSEVSTEVKTEVNEDTDTKIFNNDGNDEVTKEVKNISDIEEVISEEVVVTNNSNLKYYILYFLLLGIVVVLIVLFILFLYK